MWKSSIYISLLRSKGIPSKHIVTLRPDGSAHIWADFYLENYGWVPVDVTYKQANPGGNYFGRYDGNGIVLSKEVYLLLDKGNGDTYYSYLLQGFDWWWWGSWGEDPQIGSSHHFVSSEIELSVELLSFKYFLKDNNVHLLWTTRTETQNYGFEIYRKANKQEFTKIAFIPGQGTSIKEHNYSFIDENVPPGTLEYRIKNIEIDGDYTYSDIISVNINAPKSFYWSPNYPNPFNPKTTFNIHIPYDCHIELRICNANGQLIETLFDQFKQAGNYKVYWDASGYSSGVYFCRMTAGEYHGTQKLLLMK